MSDRRRVDREGIHIERELAERLAIEEQLDADTVGAYTFPSPLRRRIFGWVLLAAGVVSVITIDRGWMIGFGFLLLAGWQFLSSWPLHVDEHDALAVAGREVDFPIGHASASIRFHGWRSRPHWSVLLYSAADPPDLRALVLVDAVDGHVIDAPYVESIEAAP